MPGGVNFSDTLSPDTDAFTRNEDDELEGSASSHRLSGFLVKRATGDGSRTFCRQLRAWGGVSLLIRQQTVSWGQRSPTFQNSRFLPNWKVVFR